MIPERSLEVLRAIVHDYIETSQPVGSKSLVERHSFGVSSATIRNEMALLEDEQLIIAPHTSSGRVPTDKGYRLFVDRLGEVKPLSLPERTAIETFMQGYKAAWEARDDAAFAALFATDGEYTAFAGLALGTMFVTAISRVVLATPAEGLAGANIKGNVFGLAQMLFSRYVFAFEVVSLLLITAAMGAMVLAHRERLVPRPSQKQRRSASGARWAGPRTSPRIACLTAWTAAARRFSSSVTPMARSTGWKRARTSRACWPPMGPTCRNRRSSRIATK